MTTRNKTTLKTALESIDGKMTFGDMVKSLRICEEISQVDMATKLNISRQHLCNIEHGTRYANIELAGKFAEALNYPVDLFIKYAIQDELDRDGYHFHVELNAA